MPESPATARYRAARDQLLALAGEHEEAVAEFRWPEFEGPFSWAVDWFDAVARGVDRPGLVIAAEDGTEGSWSFDTLARRSDQVAGWLREQGVGKGDRVVLMLGNQVELWESMLAVMKLGAVIMPTTTALGPADLADRIGRGGARHVVANAVDAARFDGVPGGYGRIAVCGEAPGWASYADAAGAPAEPPGHPGTVAPDPLLLYFARRRPSGGC